LPGAEFRADEAVPRRDQPLYFANGRCDTFGVYTGREMSLRNRAYNRDELIEIINQALDEVEDLRVAIERR
jgi:hypothetical protein